MCRNLTDDVRCCLPCPMADWVYPSNFQSLTRIASWLSVAATICCVFMLLSWAFLPKKDTSRHYLSICLTLATTILNVSTVLYP